jgi:hypothetical protein
MTANSSIDDTRGEPVDAFDRLLSTYFKAQLKRPWPTAPQASIVEPSTFVAERMASAEPSPRKTTTPDTGSRARYTLAASVALLLATCWYLSIGFQPANRADPGPARGGVLIDSGAAKPAVLEELKHDRATKGEKVPSRQPMQLP